jgi:hypothetical protein
MLQILATDDNITSELFIGYAKNAWLVWGKLHEPKITGGKFDLNQRFNHCKLNSYKIHPDEWIDDLSLLKSDF